VGAYGAPLYPLYVTKGREWAEGREGIGEGKGEIGEGNIFKSREFYWRRK